jgi:uncharacterized protein (DUF58 family)
MFFQKSKFLKYRPRLPKQKGNKPYIVPTVYGFGFLFLVVDIFALGYYRDNGPYHIVGMTLIIFGLVSMIHTNSNLQNIDISVDRCDLGQAGSKSEIQISLRNTNVVPSHNIEVQVDKPFALKTALHVPELDKHSPFNLSIHCPKRGVYPLGRIKIYSRGVFGLFYTWRWKDIESELVVYPAPKGTLPLPMGSEGASKRSANSEDFVGHRPFRAGDSLRHIDWKAYARGADLLVKDYADQAMEALELRWEDTAGESEARLEQLSAWIIQMSNLQRPFSLHLPSDEISKGFGEAHDRAALRALALYKEA